MKKQITRWVVILAVIFIGSWVTFDLFASPGGGFLRVLSDFVDLLVEELSHASLALEVLLAFVITLIALWIGFSLAFGNPFLLLKRRLLGTFLLEHIRAVVRLRLPIGPSIAAANTAYYSRRTQKDLQLVRQNLIAGLQVGDALAKVSSRFDLSLTPNPPLVSSAEAEVLRVGESSGKLEDALDLILEQRRRRAAFSTWIYGSIIYPVAILVVLATILSGILTFIVPKFKQMFDELNVALPSMTLFVIQHGHLLVTIPVGLLALVAIGTRLRRVRPLLRRKSFAQFLAYPIHWIPFAIPSLRRPMLAEFCNELAMLISVGTPAHEALYVIADGTLNPWFRARVRKAAKLCESGASLTSALDAVHLDRRAHWFGEASHSAQSLADTLHQLADDYRARVSWHAAVLGRLIPPAVVVCLGMIVGIVVIAMFLPLIALTLAVGAS